jgi:hypothetical protein
VQLVTVDPRAWNIIAGLCVASGCGGRIISADGSTDGSGTDASASESTESNTTILDMGSGPECVTSDDCQSGYYCYDGECEYHPIPDGHLDSYSEEEWYPECFTDSDCSSLEFCAYDYCQLVFSPLACPAPDPALDLVIPGAGLALQFVDVDADGADELVIATWTELQVYESGSDIPLISPRGLESDTIEAMVGGPIDATPGDDVAILFADDLHLHASDGAGNFAAPSVEPSNWPDSNGLLALEVNGLSPPDFLIWASSGAGIQTGSGNIIPLSVDVIGSATATRADPLAFVLQHDAILDFYVAAGEEIGSSLMHGDSPYALTSIAEFGESFHLSASRIAAAGLWSIIEQWDPATGDLGTHWGLPGQVTAMAGGDFDGDTVADVAFVIDGTVQIQLAVLTDWTCLALYPFASVAQDLAVGDHDGDGDDELGIRFDGGNVVVVDGG